MSRQRRTRRPRWPIPLAVLLLALIGEGLAQAPASAADRASADPPPSAAQPAETDRIRFDYSNADIADVVSAFGELTGDIFILDEKVRGKISIITPSPISRRDAYDVLLSALEMKGFTVVKRGKIHSVVPTGAAARMAIPTLGETKSAAPAQSAREASFVTEVVQLQHVKAEEVAQGLVGLHAKEGKIAAYAPTNSLIIVDTAANQRRLKKLIAELDKPDAALTLEVIRLKNRQAQEVAETLQQVTPKKR